MAAWFGSSWREDSSHRPSEVSGRPARYDAWMTRFGWLAIPIACAACVTAPREGVHPATPADAIVAGALAASELQGETKETVFGWQLEVVGGKAKYYACTALDACSFRPVTIDVSALVATKVVSRVSPIRDDGTSAPEVDVVQLTLARERTTKRGGVSTDPRGIVVQ